MFDDLVFAITSQLDKPKEALHQNVQALLNSWFERHELVTQQMLVQQQHKIDRLEAYAADLEARLGALQKH